MSFHSSIWVKDATVADSGQVFRRPLSVSEETYYWDSVFRGTVTTLNMIEFTIEDADARTVFSQSCAESAWIRMKETWPLLGGWVNEKVGHDGKEAFEFVVEERHLSSVRPGEVVVLHASSSEEATKIHENIINSRDYLNASEGLARLWIFHRLDDEKRVHVAFEFVHIIHDGFGLTTVMKDFCKILLSPDYRVTRTLEDRLRVLLPPEFVDPALEFSAARRRWRKAIAKVMYANRQSRLHGGFAALQKPNPTEGQKRGPGFGRALAHEFSPEISSQVVAVCREAGITVGQALPVLAQVAHSRLMYRHLRDGKLSVAEFEHRRRQPMHQSGPINLRPYSSKEWYNAGGSSAVCLEIGQFAQVLPFMPSVPLERVTDALGEISIPSFLDLLPKSRFFYRCHLLKQQAQELSHHPLFLELTACRMLSKMDIVKEDALRWRSINGEGTERLQGSETIGFDNPNIVYSGSCASLGNMDPLIPLVYEGTYTPSGETVERSPVKLRFTNWITQIRCRRNMLYLSSRMLNKTLLYAIFWDENTYDEGVVKDWCNELVNATSVYLCGGDAKKQMHEVNPRARL